MRELHRTIAYKNYVFDKLSSKLKKKNKRKKKCVSVYITQGHNLNSQTIPYSNHSNHSSNTIDLEYDCELRVQTTMIMGRRVNAALNAFDEQ